MSKHMRDIEQAMNLRADFDEFLSKGDEENARACVEAMGEKGEELEAMKMHRECNAKFNHEPKDSFDVDSSYDADRSYEGAYKD